MIKEVCNIFLGAFHVLIRIVGFSWAGGSWAAGCWSSGLRPGAKMKVNSRDFNLSLPWCKQEAKPGKARPPAHFPSWNAAPVEVRVFHHRHGRPPVAEGAPARGSGSFMDLGLLGRGGAGRGRSWCGSHCGESIFTAPSRLPLEGGLPEVPEEGPCWRPQWRGWERRCLG